MSAPLRELLDDLVVHVPPAVAPPELAERAYAASRRRRRARVLRVVSIAASVVLLAALLVPAMVAVDLSQVTSGRRPADDAVSGYPRRVAGRQPDRELPATPGAMAAVLAVGDGWYVMNSRGMRWRLPVTDVGPDRPVLSRDGRMLGYPLGDASWGDEGARYVLHDLVTGRRVEFLLTPSQRIKADFGHTVGELPGFWSPDGRRLVVWGGPPDRYRGAALVLDATSGAATAVRLEAMPVGWSSAERIVWLRWDGTKNADTNPLPPYELIETDIAGRPIRSVPLAETGGYVDLWQRPEQWSAAVSADGKSLALIDRNPSKNAVRQFDLTTGAEAGPATPVDDDVARPCGLTWGKVPALVWRSDDGVVRTELLTAAHPTTVSVVSPRLDPSCMTWASNALDGAARGGGLLGTSTAMWTWWWREWLAASLAVIAVVLMLRQLRTRVRRRRPATPLSRRRPPPLDWYAE